MLLKGSGVSSFAYFHNQGTYSLSLQSISKSTPLPASLTSRDEEEHTSHFLPETKNSMLCDVKIFPDIHNIVITDHYFFSQTKSKILVVWEFSPPQLLHEPKILYKKYTQRKPDFWYVLMVKMSPVNVDLRILWTSWAAGNNLLELIWGLCGILRNSRDPKTHFLISAQHVHGVCYHKEVKLSQWLCGGDLLTTAVAKQLPLFLVRCPHRTNPHKEEADWFVLLSESHWTWNELLVPRKSHRQHNCY